MLSLNTRSNLRSVTRPAILSLFAALLSVACDGRNDPTAPTPTLTGTVTNPATGRPVAGAVVRIGAAIVTTGADGRFNVPDLTIGSATLRCTATGFVDFEAPIAVTSGTVTQDIGLTRIEVFEFGDFALYVPATVDTTRGIILALGGPNTKGFANGKPLGAPIPALEASLQALGQQFRALASARGLAVLGTSRSALANGPASDQVLLDGVATAAVMSGRPELATAPALMYGISGGGPEASGFASRNPARVAGLFLKVPVAVSSLVSGGALGVPTYMVLAELDAFVSNTALMASFDSNRGSGALWAVAPERAVVHHSLSPAQRQLTINWINTILELRLPANRADPLREIAETSGWLGNRATGQTAPWAAFSGDKTSASWLPSQATATEWQTFIAAGGG